MSVARLEIANIYDAPAVNQALEPGSSVQEVAERLGLSTYSPNNWVEGVRPNDLEEKKSELPEA